MEARHLTAHQPTICEEVLAGYTERARLATKENAEFEFYLGKKQAFEEYQKFLQSEEAQKLPGEALKELMLLFYTGSNVAYSASPACEGRNGS